MAYEQTIKIRSRIRPQLIRSSLKKGGPIAALGALVLILGGSFLPLELLKIWGIPIFVVGIFLIIIGLSSYRKLSRLQLKPNEFIYDGSYFYFSHQGSPLFKIPQESIDMMRYVEKNDLYGLGIWLKHPVQKKVSVLKSRFNFADFTADSLARFNCDLFFPYFTNEDIQDFITQIESDRAS